MIDEEELARVLCVEGGLDPDTIMVTEPRWKIYLPVARAAIAYIVPKMERHAEFLAAVAYDSGRRAGRDMKDTQP
jgi:hypothetical protein